MDVARVAALLDRVTAGDAAAADELFARGLELPALGGELEFRYACAGLTYLLDHADENADDSARERYSTLVDAHRADPERLAILRPIGARIRELESDGVLPRSLVVRSRRPRG